jgi:hypothetical protein
MQMALDTEEACAHHVRKLCPDLPDNICEDEAKRLEFLETGKMIVSCCDPQMTRMMIREMRKMSSEEKRQVRETLRWDLYKLRSDAVN